MASESAVYTDEWPVLDYATTAMIDSPIDSIPLLEEMKNVTESVGTWLGTDAKRVDLSEITRIRVLNLGEIAATSLVERTDALQPTDYKRMRETLTDALRWNSEHALANRLMGDALSHEASSRKRRRIGSKPSESNLRTRWLTSIWHWLCTAMGS